MFKESLLLLLDSCTTPLPTKLHALIHPLSLLSNQESLWTFDLDKSQVRGRYDCIRDIRRSHCHPFCAWLACLLSRSEHMLALSWSREIALSRFSVSCVSVFRTGGLSIPTIGQLLYPKIMRGDNFIFLNLYFQVHIILYLKHISTVIHVHNFGKKSIF
jgi:hypothetical protein